MRLLWMWGITPGKQEDHENNQHQPDDLSIHCNCYKKNAPNVIFQNPRDKRQTNDNSETHESRHDKNKPKWLPDTNEEELECHEVADLPPPAIVALIKLSNSSSPRIASCKWRGVIRFTFKSLEALPANSNTWTTERTYTSKHNIVIWGMVRGSYESLQSTPLLSRTNVTFILNNTDPSRQKTFLHRQTQALEPKPASCMLTSAVRYSRIAALYTAAVAPTRPWLVVRLFRWRWIRPTENDRSERNVQRIWLCNNEKCVDNRGVEMSTEPQPASIRANTHPGIADQLSRTAKWPWPSPWSPCQLFHQASKHKHIESTDTVSVQALLHCFPSTTDGN